MTCKHSVKDGAFITISFQHAMCESTEGRGANQFCLVPLAALVSC